MPERSEEAADPYLEFLRSAYTFPVRVLRTIALLFSAVDPKKLSLPESLAAARRERTARILPPVQVVIAMFIGQRIVSTIRDSGLDASWLVGRARDMSLASTLLESVPLLPALAAALLACLPARRGNRREVFEATLYGFGLMFFLMTVGTALQMASGFSFVRNWFCHPIPRFLRSLLTFGMFAAIAGAPIYIASLALTGSYPSLRDLRTLHPDRWPFKAKLAQVYCWILCVTATVLVLTAIVWLPDFLPHDNRAPASRLDRGEDSCASVDSNGVN